MDTRTSRQRSTVWLAFKSEGSRNDRAICRVCNMEVPQKPVKLPDNGKTTKLWRHLNQEHPEFSKMLADKSEDVNEGVVEQWILSSLNHTAIGFTSKVWKFFTLDETDKNISICRKCDYHVSRGCDKNTASMWNHIKTVHPDIYASAHSKEEPQEEEESGVFAMEKAMVKDQFLLHSARQNSYICKTCGTIMRLESPDERVNTNRLYKHLDHIFHKRVQHGLETPKRPILPKHYANSAKVEKRKKAEEKFMVTKRFPTPVSAEKMMVDREADMVHCSVMMHTLYAQQKRGICCDCTILIPRGATERSSLKRKPIERDDGTIECFETKSGYEFQVHACVLSIAAGKIKTLMENSGTRTIMMHDATKEAMLAFIEIIYLGKLRNLMRLSAVEICDIFCTAQFFDSSMAMKYLERECPDVIEKYINSEKSGNSSYGKFSLLLSSADSVSSITDNDKGTEISSSENFDILGASGLSLLSVSDQVTLKKSKRKRKPLSTTFRLAKNLKKDDDEEIDDPDQRSSNDDSKNGTEESHLDSGMKFEIQGDTAILRTSPDSFMDSPEDLDFNISNDSTS